MQQKASGKIKGIFGRLVRVSRAYLILAFNNSMVYYSRRPLDALSQDYLSLNYIWQH